MREMHIGEIIRQRRLELGLTQVELCDGICEPPTMSRIEKGYQTPTRSKLNAILQRLGLPGEKFYAMMSEHELEIETLKTEIASCNMREKHLEGLEKIEQLKTLLDPDDVITKQFILRCRTHFGYMVDDEVVSYTFEEKMELLLEAIHITIPDFDVEEIDLHWYSMDELKIINQIAVTYTEHNERGKAIDLYYQLLKYIKKRLTVHNDNVPVAILIAYNYSLDLTEEKRYLEAIEIAHWGWELSIKWGRMNQMGGLLYVLGEASYHLERLEDSKQFYLLSYYAFTLMKNRKDSQLIQELIHRYFDISL